MVIITIGGYGNLKAGRFKNYRPGQNLLYPVYLCQVYIRLKFIYAVPGGGMRG